MQGLSDHLFAVQKCIQYCNLFGPCDVTPWNPHQKWEAPIGDMGKPTHLPQLPQSFPLYVGTPTKFAPIGPIMYWNQLDPKGLGKGLTEVNKTVSLEKVGVCCFCVSITNCAVEMLKISLQKSNMYCTSAKT
jgi:hypothetical protein